MLKRLRNYPTLIKIILFNIVSFFIAMGLVYFAFGEGLNMAHKIVNKARYESLQGAVAQDQVRWRTLSFAGNSALVSEELRILKEHFDLLEVAIIEPGSSSEFDVIVPAELDSLEIPLYFAAKLKPISFKSLMSLKFLLYFLCSISVLVLGNLLLGFLIFKSIYFPIVTASKNIVKYNSTMSRTAKPIDEIGRILVRLDDALLATKDLTTYKAIAATTQMLAHDVRKPFSMLKTGLNLLQATSSDPNKFKSSLAFLVSEVDRATRSVDGMLTDVMEIGSSSTELIQEPASPESLIESTLGEVFRVYPKSKVAISYDLNHAAMVNVHLKKVSRIFSNIVGNAVQAMNYSGSMWFKTNTDGNFVQFCIGNAGSMIPPESLAKLFEAFFTSGKKGGTGLGLAIAQKVVQAHGGKIWCESSKTPEHPEGKVEFFFTLPIAQGAELVTTAKLLKHSDEITQMIAMMGQASNSKSDSEFNKSEGLLHQEVVQRARTLSRPLGLLIVDDESIYRSALAGWVEQSPELAQLCNIHHANGSIEAFETLKNHPIDLIITDIDMGPKSLSGFDLVKELRSRCDFNGLIFVHSNRIVPDDHRRAGELGADGFLPKPMAKGQLFKLFLQTIQTLSPIENGLIPSSVLDQTGPAETNSAEVTPGKSSPYNLIAIIDDEDIFRDQWPTFLKDFDTVCYATAEDFVKDWDHVSGKLVAVLTDKYLGSGMDGIKLGTMLRQKAPDLAIILSTSDMSVKNASTVFDMIVDKDAFEEAPKITKYLEDKASDEDLQSLMRKTIRAFDAHARDLGESPDFTAIIDSHIMSWEFMLKDLDQAAKAKLKGSMAKTEKDKLKHDIKASVTRFKILLRNLDQGEMDSLGVLSSLKSRVTDAAKH